MAGSLNKVLLIGRLGADPEIKQMVNGKMLQGLVLLQVNHGKTKILEKKKKKQNGTVWLYLMRV